MTERGSLILPSVGGDDKVNAGIANPIDIQCMYKPTQYMPYSGRFKPRDDYFKQQMNEEELNSLSKLSKEESDDGIASKRIFMLRMDCPIDPYNTTYENLRRRGICDILMTKQFKAFTLGLEIGRQLIAEHYGDANVDDKEMADDGRKRINYACAVHRRPCWCPPNADAESAVNLLDQCTNDTPLPLNITCPFRKHSERCFCLLQAEEESSLFSMLSVDDLNECDSVQEQCDYLSQCNIPFQDLDTPSPFEAEDEPVVIMEMIPKEGATQEDGVMDIPLAIRFIYIIPENSTVNFGSVIQRMIGEYGSKKRKTFKRPTQYQQHRNIRTRYQFLHLVGEIMWGQRMQYTNPQLNKDCPSIMMNEDNFVKGISMILGFEYDLRAVCSSISSVDKGTKNWQQVLHKDSAQHCFDLNSYFYGGKFCPTMQVQRNMILLDSELLELKNDNHVVLKKYNLWHYIEQKRYYDRRFKSEQGEEVSEPQNATTESNSGNLYNPQSMTSELSSNLNTDLFNDLPETDQHRIQQSVRRWKSGQEGAGLNTFRFRQQCDLALYADEGRHLKTNEERREYYDQWISKSIQDFRRYSNRQDLFLSTRGALDFVKNLKGEWNPLILGFKKLVSPSVGVGDMFIAELFYVSESLFYVSTHTGIVLFCFVCTADAFDERLNKNNWIFRGAPDGGRRRRSRAECPGRG